MALPSPIKALKSALERVLGGVPAGEDVARLKAAFASGTLVVASGGRAVAGENPIVTGDDNTVLRIDDAAALDGLLERVCPARLHQLPSEVSDFKGRFDEEAELLGRLRGNAGDTGVALTAIGGMGGIGKTALAVRLAHKLIGDYPDAQLFIDLKGVTEPVAPQDALERLIHSFEPQARLPDSLEEAEAMYRSLLSRHKAIVVLDNARDADQVRPLLPPPPSVAIITSRWAISLPGMASKVLDKLDPDASRALLRGLVPDEMRASDADLDTLAERCACLPLALRAAGSFLAVHADWSIAEYLDDLAKTRERLKGPDDRNLDVLVVLGFSAEQLRNTDPALADLWCLLSVFAADFDRMAVAAVWLADADQARDHLSQLLRWNMLEFDPTTRRYRLHDLMRDVAMEQAEEQKLSDPLSEAETRIATHYLSVLWRADELYRQGHEGVKQGLALYDLEAVNIGHGQATAARLVEADGMLAGIASAYAVGGAFVLSLRLHPRNRIAWLDVAVASSRKTGLRPCEGMQLGNLGIAYADLGESRKAIEFLDQALVIARDIGDRWDEGSGLGSLGGVYATLGETDKAIGYYEEALAIFRDIGNHRGEGNALGNLGEAYRELGETGMAIGYHEQALAIARDIGDRQGEGKPRDLTGIF